MNDLYILDLNQLKWQKIDANGILPSERSHHSALVYENKMFIIGGYDWINTYSDVWSFDISTFTWCRISNNIPKWKI